MNPLTQQGMAALKAGNRAEARALLERAVAADRDDATAWLWLAGAVQTRAEREACLNEVLRIDPQHALARKALQQTQAVTPPAKRADMRPEPPAIPHPTAPQPTAPYGFSREAFFAPQPAAAEPAPVAASPSASSEPPVFTREMVLDPIPEPPPPVPAPTPRPAPVKKAAPKKPFRRRSSLKMTLAVLGVLVLLFLTGFTFVYIIRQASTSAQPAAPAPLAAEGTPTPAASPSPQPTQTVTPQPTVKASPTPTPTQTFVPIGPTVRVQMERIQQEVASLRGLPIQSTSVALNIVTRPQAEAVLKEREVTQELMDSLKDKQRLLIALGLADTNYNLVNNVMNRVADGIGGVFLAESDEIFVIGMRFGGIEHYVYAHEFDHALVKQNFASHSLSEAACAASTDACTALTALTEGEADLLMQQWWKQYAAPQDYRDILLYRPSAMAFAEEYVPPYVIEDLSFPYEKGLAFVEVLYNQGRWARVNKAYENPPSTTEQILHPKKYLNGEAAVPVTLPALESALGAGWQLVTDDVLGEWSTYLMLAYPLNENAKLNNVVSTIASQGWGGDRLQLFHHAETDSLAMAAQWAWDTQKDADEFAAALRQQLDARYYAVRPSFTGNCWGLEGDYACVLTAPGQTLWLMAPSAELMENLRALLPDFQ